MSGDKKPASFSIKHYRSHLIPGSGVFKNIALGLGFLPFFNLVFFRLATYTTIWFFDLLHTGASGRKAAVQCSNGTPQSKNSMILRNRWGFQTPTSFLLLISTPSSCRQLPWTVAFIMVFWIAKWTSGAICRSTSESKECGSYGIFWVNVEKHIIKWLHDGEQS